MNAWQITKKDLLLLARDRRTLFILVALPLTFITILGFSTGQLFSERDKARRIRLGIVNEDQTEVAGNLLAKVQALHALDMHEFPDRQQARQSLQDEQIDVFVVIGSKYHELVEQLDLADIIFLDEGRLAGGLQYLQIDVQAGAFLANAAEIVDALVFSFATQSIAPDVLRSSDPDYSAKLMLKAKRLKKAREREGKSTMVPAPDNGDGPPRASFVYQILVPAYTVMFVFFIVNFMARSFISERDMGTLNRLRMAPVTRTGLLLGKTVPFLLISLIQTVLLFVAGRLLFGMSWGDRPWLLPPVMICTSMSATALGLVVATAVHTDAQVSAYGNFLVLIMAAISGCLMPRRWQPELMQQIGLSTPHAWALLAYEQLLSRDMADLSVVWTSCGVMLAFTMLFFAIGWWRYRRAD